MVRADSPFHPYSGQGKTEGACNQYLIDDPVHLAWLTRIRFRLSTESFALRSTKITFTDLPLKGAVIVGMLPRSTDAAAGASAGANQSTGPAAQESVGGPVRARFRGSRLGAAGCPERL